MHDDEPTSPDRGAADDPVARNRATPRRRVPGRAPTGWTVTERVLRMTAAVVAVATLTLVIALLFG